MAARKLRWGVLGVARIATEKVVPAIQASESAEVVAIASRALDRARAAAADLGIATAYGSYEALLDDADVDVVYNPLPNHLHAPWTIRAAEAHKHVLCEKPIGLASDEAAAIRAARDRAGVVIQEAFMIRTHPQWKVAIDHVRRGAIGHVNAVAGVFSFFNTNPVDIRNIAPYGGGALLDIGCYLVQSARWVFGREPRRVVALVDRDPTSGVDRLSSMLMDFGLPEAGTAATERRPGHAVATCSTQQTPYQRIQILGTSGRLEIEIPFNAPLDRPCRVFAGDGSDPTGASAMPIEVPTCNQYVVEVEEFSRAILEGTPAPLPLEDSIANMRVLDAIVRSASSGAWEQP
jgi:predicted dehydrogenase